MIRILILIFIYCAAAGLTGSGAGSAAAHDIPNGVVVNAFFKPRDNHAQLLVRVPMVAMRDIEFPERPDGFLDLARVEPFLADAATIWIAQFMDIYEGEQRLPAPRIAATRVSLESELAFLSYDSALAHVTGPKLPEDTSIVWNQAMLDVLFEYPIASDRAKFSIKSGLARLGIHVTTVLRFVPPEGNVMAYRYDGDPGLIRLDPSWQQAVLPFVSLGFKHILEGIDHLLFLLCLVIPFRRLRPLAVIVTSFTVAHSITLIAAANGMTPSALWFPPLIETLIAASIVYMALENIVGRPSLQRRWIAAFGFGLVHGFGFSFMLRDALQFAGSQMAIALASFNIGVELGQLLVVIVMIAVLEAAFRRVPERMASIVICAFVIHTAWHWMIDRGSILSQFEYQWPDAEAAATALRILTAVILLTGLAWMGLRGAAAIRRNGGGLIKKKEH